MIIRALGFGSERVVNDYTKDKGWRLKNDDAIGNIPLEWNWLVSEYDYNKNAKNVHWTLGGPYFKDYADSDYANEWFKLYADTVRIDL